ncbi:aminoacyl-tRNA hydrolase [Rickettsia endosymbiont of Cardiosporidium cionae]|uniref:aminoacyl-tRNA hydrolase n=1 Tax=Rickettsia endosymbiont of Cardiosporidium cionae TaxID=2777155 RepID=UPI001895A76F|nr:aminoacyl-tRNA hydrolase [Rickettsia endosymbiont of Cardiosporidium cionae]KAF8818933.1 aminoacyl-tRNA hydrolase [Rickettsia endosymbiont of Cardiosporidium cionae]
MILGLGNPGKCYANTRHNVGFILVDKLANFYNFEWYNKKKLKANIAYNKKYHYILCKSCTYMNMTGNSVYLIINYYKIVTKDILVIHDDIDLDFLTLRTKIGGSHAGHNGLKSIDNILENRNYHRLRIGIGRPDQNKNLDISEYVLSNFTNSEITKIDNKFGTIFSNNDILNNDIELLKEKLLS